MKKQAIAIVLGTALLWANSTLAYYGVGEGMKKGKDNKGVSAQAKGANCSPATAILSLEFNDVKARIENGGSMFQNRQNGTASYEVPKGSGLTVIFSGSLWMGGTDVNGQLKLAALRFRQGNDFWPGPLSVIAGTGDYNPNDPVGANATRDFGDANIDPDQCLAYDRFYTIRKAEVIRYNIWWECQDDPNKEGCDDVEGMTNEELNRIFTWPAHGDVSRGQDFYLAPFYDRDKDGFYNPDNGDTPWYDDILGRDDIECGIDRRISLFGDETHWWIFNDKGNIHTETKGDPIGMEIRAQAFAFATNDEVNRMTFYNYELINRGTQTLYNTFFSQFLDADVGNYRDDYAGCDVSRGLGYMFNGDLFDENDGGKLGYGDNPPAIGVDFFEGPYLDADGIDNVGPYIDPNTNQLVTPTVIDAIAGNGIVYKGIGIGYSDGIIDNERFGMRRFTYFTSTASFPHNDPQNAGEYYKFMSGQWANGSEMFYGGQGFEGSTGVTTILSDYMFPGDSDPLNWATAGEDPGFDWDESTSNNPAGDRRFVQSAGPFTLRPGAINNITVGMVYGRGIEGDLFSSVRAMKKADTKAQALFDACFKILSPPDAPRLVIQELKNELVLLIDNPATSNNYKEGYKEKDEVNIPDPLDYQFYDFEGYQIFQLKSEETSVSDITDPNKARLVAQCDLKNNISRIINFEFDEALGFTIPVEKVKGENKGIKHSFKLKEDAFAQGDRRLVNNKTYYYVAIAYAHNEFKKYDPNDPLQLDGQKIRYISSRLSYDGTAIKAVGAIPHDPALEKNGTVQRAEYGDTPEITRLDGYGNGNRSLELTQGSVDAIMASSYLATPTYQKNGGPLNVKVVDPLNVTDGYYECKFRDYKANNTNGADTASWTIYRYSAKGGALIDSVRSETLINKDNEQIIPQWGVSVQIVQEKYFFQGGAGGTTLKYTDPIEATISFSDSSKRWLSFIPDNDGFNPMNWIRSGEADDTSGTGANPGWSAPKCYKDEKGVDPKKQYAKLLGGGVAPHRLVGYQCDYMPLSYYGISATGTHRNNASISFLPSVDIVITPDKSKWTRCPVVELGRDQNLTVGGAKAGGLRKSLSVNKNGLPDGSGTTGMGWFPGYAIDLESGARLYMAFGENSFLGIDGGADMIWNPSDRLFDNTGSPVMGGLQPIYVYSYAHKDLNGYKTSSSQTVPFNFPAYNESNNEVYNMMQIIETASGSTQSNARTQLYGSLSWIISPLLAMDQTLLSSEAKIRLRVNKEYKDYNATGKNGGKPMYSWTMDELSTQIGVKQQLSDALEKINVVPNPYYAFSDYERNRLDTRVKITNLPERCEVKIYSVNGKLIRTFKKDSPITSLDWDLNNHKGIPVAGGVYLIHIDVPEVGQKVIKFFGGMRQVDMEGI